MATTPRLRVLLTRPTVALTWAGQVASVIGDRLYAVALVWVTLQLTGSASAVAWVSVADSAPFLVLSVFSGWLGDRVDGLRLARTVDVVRAVTVAAIPLMYVTGHLSVVALAGVAAVLSAQEAFFVPALQASVPRLVEPAGLTPMVSLLDSTDRLGRVLGPGLIGVLSAVPQVHLFTIDAGTFLISALCLTVVLHRVPAAGAARPSRPDAAPDTSVIRDLFVGWRWSICEPTVADALILRGVCNLAWPAFTVAIPFLIQQRFHQGIGGFGLTLAGFGAGNLIGTGLAARVRAARLTTVCCLAWSSAGIGFVGLAVAPTYPLLLAATAAIGVCTPLANVTVSAHIVAIAPRDLLARVYTAQRVTVVAASIAGLPIIAALISAHGPACALAAAGAVITTAGSTALLKSRRHPS